MSSSGIIPDGVIDDTDGGPVGLFIGSIQLQVVHATGYVGYADCGTPMPYLIADGFLTTRFGRREFAQVNLYGLAVPMLIKYGLAPSSFSCIIAADVIADAFLLRGAAPRPLMGTSPFWDLN